MATTTTQAAGSIKDFLARLEGSREVGLVIAKDGLELKKITAALDAAGYLHVVSMAHLLERLQTASKNYFFIDGVSGKEAYDLAAQYPTGQIQWFDGKAMRGKVVSPHYEGSQTVFVATKRDLTALQKKQLAIRTNVGLTYQR